MEEFFVAWISIAYKTITENEIRRNENSFQEKPISLHNIVYVKPADR